MATSSSVPRSLVTAAPSPNMDGKSECPGWYAGEARRPGALGNDAASITGPPPSRSFTLAAANTLRSYVRSTAKVRVRCRHRDAALRGRTSPVREHPRFGGLQPPTSAFSPNSVDAVEDLLGLGVGNALRVGFSEPISLLTPWDQAKR